MEPVYAKVSSAGDLHSGLYLHAQSAHSLVQLGYGEDGELEYNNNSRLFIICNIEHCL